MTSPRNTVDEILSTIRAAHRRVTVAKRTVAEVLCAADGHLSADQITTAVQRRQPEVGPSTIYRILEEFEELEIIVHSHLGQSAAVHGHLTCEECGQTVQIPASHFDALSRDLHKSYGFLLDRHHVALSGSCASCQANQLGRT
jgi:Fur family ferric uptake transcriptional regulator